MLSALDPLGLPLVTQVVAGKAADDPLYLPASKQVSQSLQEHGVLYVGDCKMAALSTRAYVQAQGYYYLCPLANKQLPDSELDSALQPVWNGECQLLTVHRATAEGEDELIAEGYEQTVVLSSEVEGQSLTWTERRLVVRSMKLAQAAQAALHARVDKAQAALAQLNAHTQGKKVYRDADSLQQAAQAILKEHQVTGLFRLQIQEHVAERPVRAYGSRPAAVRVERTTRRPTAEALLQAFQLIHLSVVMLGQQAHRHLTPLSELQKRILSLLDLSPAIYDQLGAESPKPT